MHKLVSIVVPVYNCEKYIKRCLMSICDQSYKNIEIIIIDDGSTDSTTNICKNFSKNDNRVKLISTVNKGVSSARNLGINISSGEFICFVDADDYIDLNMIEDCVRLLLVNKADIICFNREDFFINGRASKIIKLYNNKLDTYEIIQGIYTGKYSCSIFDKVYRKVLWNDIKFPNIRTSEDRSVLFEILGKVSRIIATENVYYHYQRGNYNSATGKIMLDVYFNNFIAYNIGAKIAKEKWEQLYYFALKKTFYYAIKGYQHCLFINYLRDLPIEKIDYFFYENRYFAKELRFLERLYLFDYFYFFKLLNKIKGILYYLKWKKQLLKNK